MSSCGRSSPVSVKPAPRPRPNPRLPPLPRYLFSGGRGKGGRLVSCMGSGVSMASWQSSVVCFVCPAGQRALKLGRGADSASPIKCTSFGFRQIFLWVEAMNLFVRNRNVLGSFALGLALATSALAEQVTSLAMLAIGLDRFVRDLVKLRYCKSAPIRHGSAVDWATCYSDF